MKLSVIVPVYNVEKYLPRCLDSLLRQGLASDEYEVVCVNDGSPDNCATILVEYEQKYPDIFNVITQENMGVGEARNTGMKVARGEWITFLDPDDYVIDDAYKFILEHFCDDCVDVVNYNMILAYTDGESLYDADAKPDGEIVFDGDGAEAYTTLPLPYVCSKFYRRSFCEKHQIRFEAPLMEDELFNFVFFHLHPNLRIVSSNIYRYEQGNLNSLLTMAEKEKVKTQMKWLLYVIKKMDNYLHGDDDKIAITAKRNINMFLKAYYNKMLKARLAWYEWIECTRQLKELPMCKLDSSYESSHSGKMVDHLKNWSGSSYVVYVIVEFLLRVVFTNLLRPRIIASYSK